MSNEDYVIDHKLVWTGWKNNPTFKLAQEKQAEKGKTMTEHTPPSEGASEPTAGADVVPQKRKRQGMRLTSQQAAERLGVTTSTVANLVKMGKLKNQWQAPDGQPRQRSIIALDAKEVREFAKVYRNPKLAGRMAKMTAERNGGSSPVEPHVRKGYTRGPYKPKADNPLKPGGSVYLISEDSPVQGFMTQMKALKSDVAALQNEMKGLAGMVENAAQGINQLVKLWS